jgi:recombination protein RecT
MAANQEERGLQKSEAKQLQVLQNDLQKLLPALNQALPETMKKYLTPERVVKVAMLAIRKSPLLAKCTRESIFQGIMDSASLGLDVGGLLGHAYLVPFKNNKLGAYEAQLVIGYQGYISLARRSGEVLSVKAEVVYEKDKFEIDLASGDLPKHIPHLDGDRGKPKLVYCAARFRDGGAHCEMMTMSDVEKIRMKSRAKDSGPWANPETYLEMAKKTVVRRARKYWPLSIDTASELAKAVEVEDRVEDWGESGEIISAAYAAREEEPKPRSRTEEVLARIQSDNPVTGETTWAGGPEEHTQPPAEPDLNLTTNEELLAYVRTRWAELMPETRTDADILQAMRGLGMERKELGRCSTDDLKALLKHFDRAPQEIPK